MSTIPYNTAQRRLLTAWLTGSLVLFLFMILRNINADDAQTAALWAWFLPWVVPTASVMVGVIVAEQRGTAHAIRGVDRGLFRLVFASSLVYLLLLFITLFALTLDWLRLESTAVFLTPIQAIVTGLIGIFFVQKDADTRQNRRSGDPAAPVADGAR